MMLKRKKVMKGNLLGWYMMRRGVSTDALTQKLVDGNATAVRLIEQGKALPTRDDLDVICETLKVKKTDIWDEDALDLLGTMYIGGGRQHGEQTEFRTWVDRDFKHKLEVSIKAMGFRSSAAWFRKAAEVTIKAASKRAEKRGL